MKRITSISSVLLLALGTTILLSSPVAFSQSVTSGSKVFVEPMSGFENYLTAAIQSQKVPLTVVLDRSRADYVVTGSWRESEGGTSGNGSLIAPLKRRTNYSASLSIIDPKTSAVLFAFSSEKSATHDLSKQIAEDWAKNLRDQMIGKKK